ncbi:MAG TPA: hypothetical protein VMN04_15440, partial [Thermoanaerobaculia bacterium]|nr:hypothetical protein [Thermoanaerobaculia bacterium]
MLRIFSRLCLAGLILGLAAAAPKATGQPAHPLGDLVHGPSSSFPGFQEMDGSAWISTFSAGLWRTDGTASGTVLVYPPGGSQGKIYATDGRLFWFDGPTVDLGHAPPSWLVSSDGTAVGTAVVPAPSGFAPDRSQDPYASAVGGRLLFAGLQSPSGLWESDGSGMSLLAAFPAWGVGPFCDYRDTAAFLVRPAAGGLQLWTSGGTAATTQLVKALSGRAAPDCGRTLRRLGRSLIFLADDGVTGCNVWTSNGTAAGTVPVGLVGAGTSAIMTPLASAHGILVFTNGPDVWRTDGTPGGRTFSWAARTCRSSARGRAKAFISLWGTSAGSNSGSR